MATLNQCASQRGVKGNAKRFTQFDPRAAKPQVRARRVAICASCGHRAPCVQGHGAAVPVPHGWRALGADKLVCGRCA
jgi:hypothetical protein